MGLFSAVIDRSPIDKYGAGGNASALSNYAATNMARSQELWDMNSTRNQMIQDKQMESAFDIQAQQSMMAQRQAARSGQAFTPAGMDSSASVRNQVGNQFAQLLLSQQGQAGQLSGQAGNMMTSSAQIRNNLNQLYRQQQQANQQAKQQAKSSALSMASAALGLGIGAIGSAASSLGGSGGSSLPGSSLPSVAGANIPGGFGQGAGGIMGGLSKMGGALSIGSGGFKLPSFGLGG